MKLQRFLTSGPIFPMHILYPELFPNRKDDDFPLIGVPSMGEQGSADPGQVHPMWEQSKDGGLNIVKVFDEYACYLETKEKLQERK